MTSDHAPGRRDDSFTGSVVMVCGGATGIGAATVTGFARAGALTVLADVDDVRGASLVTSLVTTGHRVAFRHCDVSVEDDVEATFEWVVATYGGLDVVFANAGIEWTKDARHTSLVEWRHVLDVNLTGMFLVARASLRRMCKQRRGVVIMTSSPHAVATVADTVAYAASKGGVSALVHALSLEAAPYGVRVVGVVPGTIDTPMVHREFGASSDPQRQLSTMASAQPLQRVGQPEDVANLVMFLASSRASFITGSLLSVDGGLMSALPGGPPSNYRD